MPFVRFCSAVLSAYVFTALFMPDPALLLWRLSRCGGDGWEASCDETFEWYGRLGFVFKLMAAFLWVGAWALLELSARRRPGRRRLLAHLSYGPPAVLLLACLAVVSSDVLLIQYSRWQIALYVRGDAPPLERPSLDLYNDDRGWCMNGIAAREYQLYGATAAAHFDDPDPAVRARALQASLAVYDWAGDPREGPAVEVLRRAADDPDPLVRRVAAAHPELLSAASP